MILKVYCSKLKLVISKDKVMSNYWIGPYPVDKKQLIKLKKWIENELNKKDLK